MGSNHYNRKIMPVSAWRKHRGRLQMTNLQCFQEFRSLHWEVHTRIPLTDKPRLFVQQYLDGVSYTQAVYLTYARRMIAIAYI